MINAMKKLILIFGVFSIICVVVSHVSTTAVENAQTSAQAQLENSAYEASFTVKSLNDRIVVYKGDELYYKTNTSVNTLPKSDRRVLLEGIVVKDEQQLKEVLADYCS